MWSPPRILQSKYNNLHLLDLYLVVVMIPEAVDSGGVLDGVGLAVVPDVAVLADPLVVARALLAVHHAVLLGEGGPELARPGIEPLLLQDPGQGAVHLRGRANQTGQNGNLDSEQGKLYTFTFASQSQISR